MIACFLASVYYTLIKQLFRGTPLNNCTTPAIPKEPETFIMAECGACPCNHRRAIKRPYRFLYQPLAKNAMPMTTSTNTAIVPRSFPRINTMPIATRTMTAMTTSRLLR